MAALTGDRNTPMLLEARNRELGAAAGVTLYVGAMAARSATGFATPGATATGLRGLGRVKFRVDNAGGADGAAQVVIERGTFRFANSAAGDAITNADIGETCFMVDDQTVARTDGTGTRSPAGTVYAVDAQGVWVEFN